MGDPVGWNGKVKFSNLSVFDKAKFQRNFYINENSRGLLSF
jgi:hypothetical protein